MTSEQVSNRGRYLTALEVNEIKQGRGLLHNERDNSYCALGVAKKIFNLGPEYIISLYSPSWWKEMMDFPKELVRKIEEWNDAPLSLSFPEIAMAIRDSLK